jgi:hypothetical protein
MKKFLTKNHKSILSAIVLVCVLAVPMLVLPSIAGAEGGSLESQINAKLGETGLENSLGGTPELPQLVGNLITAILALLGVIFVAFIIYAGFKWMTSNGDSAKVDKAKAMIVQSTIGLIIMLISYGITEFIINSIMNSTN